MDRKYRRYVDHQTHWFAWHFCFGNLSLPHIQEIWRKYFSFSHFRTAHHYHASISRVCQLGGTIPRPLGCSYRLLRIPVHGELTHSDKVKEVAVECVSSCSFGLCL